MGKKLKVVPCTGILLSAMLANASVLAQESATSYPSHSIKIVVPLAPGGANDLVARVVAQKVGESLKQAIVVDNRGGGGGVIGTDMVAKAAPDGYTLLESQATTVLAPAFYPKLPYDTLRDLQAITQLTSASYLLAVHPSLPVQNFPQFLAYAKAHPGQLNNASAGTGTGPHLAMELLSEIAGLKITQITYKGGGPAILDFVAGRTEICLTNISTLMPLVKQGKARAIATSRLQRAKSAPDIPTIAESGVPGFDEGSFIGLMAPSGVPKPIIAKLHAEIVKQMNTPEVVNRLAGEGLEVTTTSSEEYGAKIKGDIAKWSKVIAQAGIKPED